MGQILPGRAATHGFDLINLVEAGERAFVTYEGKAGGKTFRNTEVRTVRGGKIEE